MYASIAINASKLSCAIIEETVVGTAPTNGARKKLLTEKRNETRKLPWLASRSSRIILNTKKTIITPVIPRIIERNRVLKSSI